MSKAFSFYFMVCIYSVNCIDIIITSNVLTTCDVTIVHKQMSIHFEAAMSMCGYAEQYIFCFSEFCLSSIDESLYVKDDKLTV